MAITVTKVLTKIFGSRNERLLKRFHRHVTEINALEPKVQLMSDEALRDRTQELRAGLVSGKLKPASVMHEAFAIIREAMDRNIGIRQIFNPDQAEVGAKFDPDRFDDKMLAAYDEVQRRLIATGESWRTVPVPVELYNAVRALYPESRPPFRRAVSTCSSSAAWCSTRGRSPRWRPARERPSSRRWPAS